MTNENGTGNTAPAAPGKVLVTKIVEKFSGMCRNRISRRVVTDDAIRAKITHEGPLYNVLKVVKETVNGCERLVVDQARAELYLHINFLVGYDPASAPTDADFVPIAQVVNETMADLPLVTPYDLQPIMRSDVFNTLHSAHRFHKIFPAFKHEGEVFVPREEARHHLGNVYIYSNNLGLTPLPDPEPEAESWGDKQDTLTFTSVEPIPPKPALAPVGHPKASQLGLGLTAVHTRLEAARFANELTDDEIVEKALADLFFYVACLQADTP